MQGFSKKTQALLLLLAAAIPVLIISSLVIKQTFIQHNMEERLEKASLEEITIDVANFKWLKEGKEAEVNGRLFDVKEYKITGSSISLKGLYDDDESEVKKSISGLYKPRQNNQNSPINMLLVKFFSSTIIDRSFFSAYLTKNKYYTITGNTFKNYSESLMQCFIPVITPPPNI